MSRWKRFVEWCREPSKIRIRSFNPKNIMVIELSILIISLFTSGTWLFTVFSITQTRPIITSFSGDGTKIAFTSDVDGDYEVFVVNSDGTGLTQLTSNPLTDREASISGDGTKIAFTSNIGSPLEDHWVLYVVNSDGTGLTELPCGGLRAYPSISGDGTKIAFHSWSPAGELEVFVVNSDGTGLTQLTHNHFAMDQYVSISGDGTKIAFHSNVDGDDEVFVVNSDGTGLTQLTDNTATDQYASISGDGTKIAFTSNVDGGHKIFLITNDLAMPLPTSEAGNSFPGVYALASIVAVIVVVILVSAISIRRTSKN